MLEEAFFEEEKELEQELEEEKKNDCTISESEEEGKSSESESPLKENNEKIDDLVNMQEDFLDKSPKKEVKKNNILDLSEKKLPKEIDFCRFSNDYLCEFSKNLHLSISFNIKI